MKIVPATACQKHSLCGRILKVLCQHVSFNLPLANPEMHCEAFGPKAAKRIRAMITLFLSQKLSRASRLTIFYAVRYYFFTLNLSIYRETRITHANSKITDQEAFLPQWRFRTRRDEK